MDGVNSGVSLLLLLVAVVVGLGRVDRFAFFLDLEELDSAVAVDTGDACDIDDVSAVANAAAWEGNALRAAIASPRI